jgi:hypothetical protein
MEHIDKLKPLFIAVAILLVLYIVLSPRIVPFLYSGRVFYPIPCPDMKYDGPPIHGVIPEDVYFNAPNGNRLHGWYFKSPGSKYIAVVNHGNRGNISTMSHLVPVVLLLSSGVSALLYDYEGYGCSQGKPSAKGILADGKAAYNFTIEKLGYKPQQIIEYGESLGCAVAGRLSVCNPCAGVILQSGFASLERIGKEVMPIVSIYPSFLFPLPRLDTAQILKQPHPPLLILHGKQDTVVPFAHAETLYESASPPRQLVALPNTAHHDLLMHEHDAKLAVDAIRQFVSGLNSVPSRP